MLSLHDIITCFLVYLSIGAGISAIHAACGAYRFYSTGQQIVLGMFDIAWWPLVLWQGAKRVRRS